MAVAAMWTPVRLTPTAAPVPRVPPVPRWRDLMDGAKRMHVVEEEVVEVVTTAPLHQHLVQV